MPPGPFFRSKASRADLRISPDDLRTLKKLEALWGHAELVHSAPPLAARWEAVVKSRTHLGQGTRQRAEDTEPPPAQACPGRLQGQF